jgi:hypothetical protein
VACLQRRRTWPGKRFVIPTRPAKVRGLLAPNPETDHPPIDFILRGKNPEAWLKVKREGCYDVIPGAFGRDWRFEAIIYIYTYIYAYLKFDAM